MKIVYHDRYAESYASDPAAAKGRLEPSRKRLEPAFDLVSPDPAAPEDILRVHTDRHLQRIKERTQLYELSLLAAGGAMTAARLALAGEQAFGLIRPPGHHASPDSCWGFCWFNNMAVALESLRAAGSIESALIVDFDLHFGDGTSAIYSPDAEVEYFHTGSVRELERFLAGMGEVDLVGVSAGFDRHVDDWGGQLNTEDYRRMGRLLAEYADRSCQGRIFSILEGGYNHDSMAEAIDTYLEGLRES